MSMKIILALIAAAFALPLMFQLVEACSSYQDCSPSNYYTTSQVCGTHCGWAKCGWSCSTTSTLHYVADPNSVYSCVNQQVYSCSYYHPSYGCSNAGRTSCGYVPGSACSVSSCSAGKANCDGSPSNGCEVTLASDNNNCGACGNACTAGQVCQSGSCVTPTDFSIAVDPSAGVANKGDSKTANVTIALTSGTATSTAFSASGAPAGTTVAFGPVSCTPNCYSNMTITTTSSTPTGSSMITVKGTAGSVVKTATYNLTVLSDSCNFNNVCESPETQKTCGPPVANDCQTTASMSSPVSPGDIATVTVEFFDYRYFANEKVKIDLSIDGSVPWTPSNGCFFGGVRMGPTSGGDGTIAWPSGTISTAGHFKITTSCQVPNTISAGAHTLTATPTII